MDLSKKQIIDYLNSDGKELFELANSVRKKFVGDKIHLRGLIEISNYCKRNCFYCGIRNSNKTCERYRLSIDEILTCVETAVELDYKTVVLQGGEDDFYTPEKLKPVFEILKQNDIAITLSLGEKTYDEYAKYKDYGADRYLLRIETTDKNLYEYLHPKMDYENRVNCLKNLKKLGYEVGTGCLIGLPNQTISSLADDILFFKDIGADMVGVGPFLPAKNTPLENNEKGSLDTTLKVIALTRILLEDVNIPATTALETICENGRILALNCGANVIMPNVGFEQTKKLYSIYPDKNGIDGSPKDLKDKIVSQVLQTGRTISTTKGFRNKK